MYSTHVVLESSIFINEKRGEKWFKRPSKFPLSMYLQLSRANSPFPLLLRNDPTIFLFFNRKYQANSSSNSANTFPKKFYQERGNAILKSSVRLHQHASRDPYSSPPPHQKANNALTRRCVQFEKRSTDIFPFAPLMIDFIVVATSISFIRPLKNDKFLSIVCISCVSIPKMEKMFYVFHES